MTKLRIIKGDITELKVDAIVNAANGTLMGGGGVDGMIHMAAGPGLWKECKTLGGCETGEVKITKGYNLPADYVIHTVGPYYGYEHDNEELLLAKCYVNSLKLAEEYGLKTIAFPAISTGAFGYPKEEAAHIAVETVKHYVSRHPEAFDEIVFILFTPSHYEIYRNLKDAKQDFCVE